MLDMPLKASEVVHVKVVAPTVLICASVPGLIERGKSRIVNVDGMIAFSGPHRTPRAAPSMQGGWPTSSP